MAVTQPLLDRLESRDSALQLREAAAAVAANYRAAQRAKSHRDFTAKLTTVLEEADEAMHWLHFIQLCGWLPGEAVADLYQEAGELVAIFTRAVVTARRRDGRYGKTSSERPGDATRNG